MKRLAHLVTEVEKDNPAHQQAVKMGLKYSGFGYWKDPLTGQVKYKTEGESLIPVEGENQEAELAGAGARDGGKGRPPGMRGMPGGMGGGMGMSMPGFMGQMNPNVGQNVGNAPEAGEEQPEPELGWEAGPDGDTCAGPDAQPPGQVPEDSFVGRFNNPRWKAGPDGTNFSNISYEKLIGSMMEATDQNSLPLKDAGYEEKEPTNRAIQRVRRVMGRDTIHDNDRTDREGRSAVEKLRKDHHTVLGRQIADMMRIANRQPRLINNKGQGTTADVQRRMDASAKRRNEDNKDADMWRKVAKLPAVAKDAEAVKRMNEAIKPMLPQPDYDLTLPSDADEDSYDFIDGGAFGQVFDRDDGNVIKHGRIGPKEIAALAAMKDNPAFPTLINAKFDTPFNHQSSYENNPMGDDEVARGENADYWDPDDQSEFDMRFPSAEGTYAMTKAAGGPAFNSGELDGDTEIADKMRRNFWKARRALHEAGFSHNDMHGGNIFVDDETGDVQIIDLGLANDNPLSALMEALGGSDYEQGGDYQLSRLMGGSGIPGSIRERFDRNRGDVEELLQDNYAMDDDAYDDVDEDGYSPTRERGITAIQDMLRGDIRMRLEDLNQIKQDIPYLQDDNNIMQLIKTLYKEVGQSELADRMSDAFDERQKDSRLIRTANRIRKSKGEKPIDVKNPNVIPPRNLDFDD